MESELGIPNLTPNLLNFSALAMALVQGEDSESDEEINTELLTDSGSLGHRDGAGHPSLQSEPGKASIVAGEESETDEEDDESAPSEQTDSVSRPQPSPSPGSSRESSRRTSLDSTTSAPPSLLHKRLRDSNISLRRNIVDRILKMYHTICRNLTIVNDNLSRAQGTVEKVNAHLKRSDHELAQLNSIMEDIHTATKSFAPTIRTDITLPRRREVATPVASVESTPERGTDVSIPPQTGSND